jgi:hypothetical protein
MPSYTIDTTVDINAGKDAVWDVLIDFASYREWNPSMRIEGVPEVGTKLVVHLTGERGHGMTFKPKVLAGTPGEELRWLGKLAIHGIADREHFFILTTNHDGTTRLNHGGRYSGALVAACRRQLSEQWVRRAGGIVSGRRSATPRERRGDARRPACAGKAAARPDRRGRVRAAAQEVRAFR